MLRDRGGKPRVPDVVKDKEEMEEFRKLEPWNRPNVVVSKITSLIEHHRRMGNLGERACLDVFRDCQVRGGTRVTRLFDRLKRAFACGVTRGVTCARHL